MKGLAREFSRFDTDPNASYQWDLSPDGTRIALGEIGTGHIHVLSLAGQRLTEITVKGWSSLENFHWSAGGNGFFAASRTAETSVLLSLDLDGNANVLWEQKGTLGNESAGTSGSTVPGRPPLGDDGIYLEWQHVDDGKLLTAGCCTVPPERVFLGSPKAIAESCRCAESAPRGAQTSDTSR